MSEETPKGEEIELSEARADEVDDAKSAPADRDAAGPFDVSEVPAMRPYVDLGSIKLAPREGLQLRLEVDENSKRVVAVTIEYQESLLQMQAFSAPKTTGLWHGIRQEIAQQLSAQGSTLSEQDGQLGIELIAETPIPSEQGGGTRKARFVAVDGPRWLLRGVVMGKAADDDAAHERILGVFREAVVVRGDGPMPPNELLPLHVPAGAQGAADAPAPPTVSA